MRDLDVKKLAAWVICASAAGIGAYLIFKYALGIFLPFLIAWGLAIIVSPLARRVSEVTRLPRGICAAAFTALLIGLIVSLTLWAAGRLIDEGQRLLIYLSSGGLSDIIESISALWDIEGLQELMENMDGVISLAASELLAAITRSLPKLTVSAISAMPSLLLFLVITVISCFYFAIDLPRIHSALSSLLPRSARERLPAIKKAVCDKCARYARAYFLLLLLTFFQLLVGFSILGVSYPFLIALLTALIDILPVLGVGTVLIPWGLYMLIFEKNVFMGMGLLIIFIIVTVVRQITEPRIVAGSLGLPPLLTIVSMYAGLKLFGLFGMILGPCTVLIIKSARTNSASAVDTEA